MKAFLSHSSLDKPLIRQVAESLGRFNCVFDEKSFESGVEFEKSITEKLSKSTLFVFFASKRSIDSFWCKYELSEAFYATINNIIDSSIVIIIDDYVNHRDLPSWLNRTLVIKQKSPKAISREIRHHLEKNAEKYLDPVFIGRSKETGLLEDALNPIGTQAIVNVVNIFGLPGIGRRTLIKDVANNLFSLHKCVEVEIDSGENINTLCAKLADIIEPYSSIDELRLKVDSILKLTEEEALERVIDNLKLIIKASELPIFIDKGGLILENGCLVNFFNEIIEKFIIMQDIYICLVSNRRISQDNLVNIQSVPVEQLSEKASSQLLTRLARRENIELNVGQARELSDYINGYPPAAYFAIQHAKTYTVDSLISDKRKLTQFSQKRFITHLQDHKLDEADKMILKILSGYSPLPLKVILGLFTEMMSEDEGHDKLYQLIDSSLVRIVDGNSYGIADPIKGSVSEVFGYPSNEELNKVYIKLKNFIETVEEDKKLELSRVLFRLSQSIEGFKGEDIGISLNSDYIKLLEDNYHQRRYKEAVEIGRKAVELNPKNSKALTFLIKALIQEEEWDEAEEVLSQLNNIDEPKNFNYLKGFYNRKKGNLPQAIQSYEEAYRHGRKDFALYRELSHCYLIEGDLNNAKSHIMQANAMQPNNNQVIDMATKVLTRLGEYEDAEKYLEKLRLLDKQEHYYLRLSYYLLSVGRYPEAETAALASLEHSGDRFFAGRIQLIKSQIFNKNFEDAERNLGSLDNDFPKNKLDVKTSLRVSLALAKGDYELAFKRVNTIINKQSVQYKSLRAKCLSKLVEEVHIPFETKKSYIDELKSTRQYLDMSYDEI